MAAMLLCPKCNDNIAISTPPPGNVRCVNCGLLIVVSGVMRKKPGESPDSMPVGITTSQVREVNKLLKNPNSVQGAALIWFIAGIVAELYAIYAAFIQTEAATDWEWFGARLILVAEVAAGAMFIVFGIQSRLGTASDVGGNALVSFYSAPLGVAVAYLNQLGRQPVDVGAGLFWTASLLIAGALAVSGRDEYLLWREQRADSNAKSRHMALIWFLAICAVVAVIASVGHLVMPAVDTQPKPVKELKRSR